MTCKLTYPQQIRWRLRLLWLALAAQLVLMVVIGEMGLRDSRVITGLAYTGGSMMFWGGMIFLIARIVVNRRLLRDKLRLKEQQLLERDERNQYLHHMSGGWVMDALLILAYVGAVIASCCSVEAFYAAFGLLACASALKGGAYMAYSRGWLSE